MADPGALGRNVERLRVDLGWTQVRLADESGVSQAFISSLEGGRRQDAESRLVAALAKALGVTVDALLEEEGEANAR